MITDEPVIKGSFLYELNEDEMQRIWEFSEKVAKKQVKEKHHGEVQRSEDEIIGCTAAGKVAEQCYSNFFDDNLGLYMPVDYEIYEDGADDGDLISPINGKRVELKSFRHKSKWLLVDWVDIANKQNDNKEPDVYVMVKVFWDYETPKPLNKAIIVGYATPAEMRGHVKGTLDLRRGDYIPGTKQKLYNNNVARRDKFLHKNWNHLYNFLRKEKT